MRVFFRSRSDTALEVLALRQQVAVLKRKRPRPVLNSLDRLFWTTLRRRWSRWADVLLIVKPETVIGWHRAGFRLYWRWRSRPRAGRPKISDEIHVLIRRLAQENPDWGAPRIHGELQKLGFVLSERSVARYLRRLRRRGDPDQRWLAFLHNHRDGIAAMDFFTVPTVTFGVLYVWFAIEHGRRRWRGSFGGRAKGFRLASRLIGRIRGRPLAPGRRLFGRLAVEVLVVGLGVRAGMVHDPVAVIRRRVERVELQRRAVGSCPPGRARRDASDLGTGRSARRRSRTSDRLKMTRYADDLP